MNPTKDAAEQLSQEMRAMQATGVCFAVGALVGALVLWGDPRPLTGTGSISLPVAFIAAAIAAASYVVSTVINRRGETRPMPRWQAVISDLSSVALMLAFAGVTGLGVLLATQVLGVGLQGLEVPVLGDALITGVASALGGRLAFTAGIGLRTSDIATLLFSYLIVGTLFAMLTAADPRWWAQNFSRLGFGQGAWAFNGTLVVAGVLMMTVGSYIGRDMHRLFGDPGIRRIEWVVALWAATGVALGCVGVFPEYRAQTIHGYAALATLSLLVVSMIVTTIVFAGAPAVLRVTTVAVVVLIPSAFFLFEPLNVYPLTALEAIVIGLGLLWMATLVRVLEILVPDASRPSRKRHLAAAMAG